MTYVTLFLEFFKIGLLAVGGGLATLPFLADLTRLHPEWFDMGMLSNMVAVSNATPGPLGVNMATYVGFTVGGVFGGVLATFALVLPSVIVVLAISRFLSKFRSSEYVEGAFSGLRPAVAALIALAGIELMKLTLFHLDTWKQADGLLSLFNLPAILFFAVMIPLIRKTKWPIIVYIIIGAVVGILFQM